PVLHLVIGYARLNLDLHAVFAIGLDVAPDAKHERRGFRRLAPIRLHDGPVSVSRRWKLNLRSQGGDSRSSNVLANPPFLRNAHLEIGASARATAVRIEPHLVSCSALVGHDELREVAGYMQALRFHFFHCPTPAIARLRLKNGQRQGCGLWT